MAPISRRAFFRMAAADAVITTHAIARGDLAPAVDSEYVATEAGDVAGVLTAWIAA